VPQRHAPAAGVGRRTQETDMPALPDLYLETPLLPVRDPGSGDNPSWRSCCFRTGRDALGGAFLEILTEPGPARDGAAEGAGPDFLLALDEIFAAILQDGFQDIRPGAWRTGLGGARSHVLRRLDDGRCEISLTLPYEFRDAFEALTAHGRLRLAQAARDIAARQLQSRHAGSGSLPGEIPDA